MTKNRSRNPHTKKGARSAPTIKPGKKPNTKTSAKKVSSTKQPKTNAPVNKSLTTRKPAPKKAATKTPVTKAPRSKTKPAKTSASALTITQRIVNALENLKGKDIVCMDVRKLTDVTDTLIVVSGTSSRHVKSLADNAALELKKVGHRAYGIEGNDAGEWVLVDFGDVVLHVMQPHIREFYDLEKLWSTPATPDKE